MAPADRQRRRQRPRREEPPPYEPGPDELEPEPPEAGEDHLRDVLLGTSIFDEGLTTLATLPLCCPGEIERPDRTELQDLFAELMRLRVAATRSA